MAFALVFLGVVAYVLLRAGVGVYPGIDVALDIADDLPSMRVFPPLAQSFQQRVTVTARRVQLTTSSGSTPLPPLCLTPKQVRWGCCWWAPSA